MDGDIGTLIAGYAVFAGALGALGGWSLLAARRFKAKIDLLTRQAESAHAETAHVETAHVETSHAETSHVETAHAKADLAGNRGEGGQ